jgi:hypothetical protein
LASGEALTPPPPVTPSAGPCVSDVDELLLHASRTAIAGRGNAIVTSAIERANFT